MPYKTICHKRPKSELNYVARWVNLKKQKNKSRNKDRQKTAAKYSSLKWFSRQTGKYPAIEIETITVTVIATTTTTEIYISAAHPQTVAEYDSKSNSHAQK